MGVLQLQNGDRKCVDGGVDKQKVRDWRIFILIIGKYIYDFTFNNE